MNTFIVLLKVIYCGNAYLMALMRMEQHSMSSQTLLRKQELLFL